jgi:hypothetical protein
MNRPSIKTAWDEAGDVRWTGADKARFDRAFRAWAKRTGNETAFEIRQERGEDGFSQARKRRRTS